MRSSTKMILTDKVFATEDTIHVYPPSDVSAHSSIRRACKCGAIDPGTKIRPLDKDRVMEFTGRICDRLEEENIEFDKDELYDAARDRKEDPERQFDEETIFEEAVNLATEN